MPEMQRDEILMQRLLAKLYRTLTAGDDTVQESPDNFIAWCLPGIPFAEEDFDFAAKGLGGGSGDEVRRLLTQASAFARLVNRVPDPSGVYDKDQQATALESSDHLVWNVYRNVLDMSEVVATELTDEQKEKVEKFRNLLRVKKVVKDIVTDEEKEVLEDGPMIKAYLQRSKEYDDAVLAYNAIRISAMSSDSGQAVAEWATNADVYRRRVHQAMQAWVSGGYKNDVDKINAFLDQVTRRDLTLLKARLLDEFDAGQLTDLTSGLKFWPTFVTPATFATAKGWTRFSFSETEERGSESTQTNAWDVKGSGGWGLFKAGGGSSGEISKSRTTLDTSNFSMSFELTQVPISRPWFGAEFVRSSAWRFAEGKTMLPLSDGGSPPKGQMVAYPTTAIFIRDAELSFGETHDETSELNRQISSNADVSYGPFNVSGKYNHGSGEKNHRAVNKDGTLSIPGLQLIAMKCAILGKTPNPDPEIDSWT